MKKQRILIWLISGLLIPKSVKSEELIVNKYYDNLCHRTQFFMGSSRVTSFCGTALLPKYLVPQLMAMQDVGEPEPGPEPKSDLTMFHSVCPELPTKSAILVSGGDIRSYSLQTITNHLLFSAIRKMVYLYADVNNFKKRNSFLKPQWLKVQLLRDILRDEFIPEHSWIVWVDDDLILKHTTQTMIDRYIVKYGEKASVIITKDTYPWPGDKYDARFNTGVIMVQKNNISRKIFTDWWRSRPDSKQKQQEYIPPNQHGLKLVLSAHDYVKQGDLKIAPQRTKWGNLNTFHLFDHWETSSHNGLAEIGDAAVQHPGIDIKRKHELIMQTLAANPACPLSNSNALLLTSSCNFQKELIYDVETLEQYLNDCIGGTDN